MAVRSFNPFEELQSKSILETLGLLPRTTSFVFRSTPFYFIVSNSTGIIQAGLSALLLWLGKVVIDRIVASLDTDINWFIVLFPMIAIVITHIVQSIFNASTTFINFMVVEKVNSKSYSILFEKATMLDLVYYEFPEFYDRLYQARTNVGNLHGAVHSLLGVASQTFMLFAMFSLLSTLHPLAFFVLFAAVAPRIIAEGYTARKRFDLGVKLTRNYRLTSYFHQAVTSRNMVKEIKVFSLASYFMKKFFEFRELVIRSNFELNVHFLKLEVVLDIVGTLGLCVVWIYAVYRASMGEISIGDLFMVFGAAQSSKESIEVWFSSVGGIFENSLYLTRFFELVDLDPQTAEGALDISQKNSGSIVPAGLNKGIELKNVSFRYPGTDHWVLKDISLVIPANNRLAIVGENGSGKTTLVKLLTRFYDPIDGSVSLDGRDYREYDVDELRNGITVIFQDFARYDFSVADNIGVGYVDAMNDRPRIVQSAKSGGAHDMAMKLPNQYDTMLGRTYDEGVDLSGGEWQNVAISRAFMNDAHLFILDEPTAALDAFKEAEVFDRFAHLTEGRTVVLVSHRFSTVRMADLICVIEDGRIIEYGSHEDLIKLNGKYRQMYDAQAERYR